jgi:hypothetical protein
MTVDVLASLIEQHRFDEAEALSTEFIAQDTDRAASRIGVPAVEFYLRDCVFNRGASGGARIFDGEPASSPLLVDGSLGA